MNKSFTALHAGLGNVEKETKLPVSSQDVLTGLNKEKVIQLEQDFGNGDLMRVLQILGIGGPFKVLNPWELEDETGQQLINAGGYAALPFGEKPPELVSFMARYLTQSSSMGLPQQSVSDWRAALEANLIHLLALQDASHADSQVFFSNSGAEAVEAALKFVKGARPKAKMFINFTRAYHGKTIGALSVTANEEYQAPFRPLMSNAVKTLPFGDAQVFEATIKNLNPKDVIAVILEPIQGEGGVITPPKDFLPTVNAICKKHGILMIADEIQSGLGRTGHWFASLAGGLEPDIITLAKPLGGGVVPIGATITRKNIIQKVLGGVYSKRHSTTFGGNSLAMAVGLKSLEMIVEHNLVERSQQLGEQGLKKLLELKEAYPGYIKEVRGAGMLFAVQLRNVIKPQLIPGQAELVKQLGTGLALRTMHLNGLHVCYTENSSQLFRFTPALNMPQEMFDEMFQRLENTAKSHGQAWTMLPRTSLDRLLKLAKFALT